MASNDLSPAAQYYSDAYSADTGATTAEIAALLNQYNPGYDPNGTFTTYGQGGAGTAPATGEQAALDQLLLGGGVGVGSQTNDNVLGLPQNIQDAIYNFNPNDAQSAPLPTISGDNLTPGQTAYNTYAGDENQQLSDYQGLIGNQTHGSIGLAGELADAAALAVATWGLGSAADAALFASDAAEAGEAGAAAAGGATTAESAGTGAVIGAGESAFEKGGNPLIGALSGGTGAALGGLGDAVGGGLAGTAAQAAAGAGVGATTAALEGQNPLTGAAAGGASGAASGASSGAASSLGTTSTGEPIDINYEGGGDLTSDIQQPSSSSVLATSDASPEANFVNPTASTASTAPDISYAGTSSSTPTDPAAAAQLLGVNSPQTDFGSPSSLGASTAGSSQPNSSVVGSVGSAAAKGASGVALPAILAALGLGGGAAAATGAFAAPTDATSAVSTPSTTSITLTPDEMGIALTPDFVYNPAAEAYSPSLSTGGETGYSSGSSGLGKRYTRRASSGLPSGYDAGATAQDFGV